MFDDNIIRNELDQYTMRTLNQIETFKFYQYIIKWIREKSDIKNNRISISSLIKGYGIELTYSKRVDVYNDLMTPFRICHSKNGMPTYEIDFYEPDFEYRVLDFYNTYLAKCETKEDKIDLCQHLLKYLVSKHYNLPYSKRLITEIDEHTKEIILYHKRESDRYIDNNPAIKMIAYFNGNYLG